MFFVLKLYSDMQALSTSLIYKGFAILELLFWGETMTVDSLLQTDLDADFCTQTAKIEYKLSTEKSYINHACTQCTQATQAKTQPLPKNTTPSAAFSAGGTLRQGVYAGKDKPTNPAQVLESHCFDDRITCGQCASLLPNQRCQAAAKSQLFGTSRGYSPVCNQPRRCEGYQPKPGDPDQRPGQHRWPGLSHPAMRTLAVWEPETKEE
jgi:hypothetical protein